MTYSLAWSKLKIMKTNVLAVLAFIFLILYLPVRVEHKETIIVREVPQRNHYEVALRTGRQIIVPNMRMEGGFSLCSATMVDVHAITTARHCFDKWNPTVGQVIIINGQPATVQALVLGEENRDQVAIRLNTTFTQWALVALDRPAIGERVFLLGNPGGNADFFREGYVSKLDGRWNRLDMNVTHGDSGSGVFNSQGRLIGSMQMVADEPLDHAAAFMGFKFDPAKLREAGITLHY